MVETHGRLEIWKKRFINNLSRLSHWGNTKIGKVADRSFRMSNLPFEKWAMLLYRGAWYACYNGKIAR
jgi:hypothetical protein